MPNSATPVAEVISIGDEMTSGARLDTNSQWLSVALQRLGIRVLYHSTVGDSLEACREVIGTAANRASIIVATGGLGPTEDDLTREALAAAAGVPLEFRAEAMAHIERIFARRGRTFPERNRVQAMFPASSRTIPNPQGTAPGIDLDLPNANGTTTRLFALPGVPAEMKQMWDQTVQPELARMFGTSSVIRHAVIKCFGLGESDMEAMLGGMIARDRVPQVGITVSRATISLRIDALASSPEAAAALIEQTREQIYARVGEYVIGEGEETELQDVIKTQLAARGETLGVVECGFSATIASWLAETERPDIFLGGFQFPDLRHAFQMAQRLRLDSPAISAPDASPLPSNGEDRSDRVGEEGELAKVFRDCLQTDWCLIVDAYPSMTPPPEQVLPGADVRFLIVGPTTTEPHIHSAHIGAHPEILHARIGKAGLFELLRVLRTG